MKKRWKIFWIVCGGIAAAGILLCVMGLAAGAVTQIAGFIHSRGGTEPYIDPEYEPDMENREDVTAFTGISSMEIDVTDIGVDVRTYDGEEILVDIGSLRSDLRDQVEISQQNGELEIVLDRDQKIWDTNENGTIYVSVPGSLRFDEVTGDLGTGLLEMSGIQTGTLSLDVGVGTAEVNDFTADNLEVNCGVGSVVLNGETAVRAKICCSVGEVTYTAAGAKEDYDYILSCGLGEVLVDSEVYSDLGEENIRVDRAGNRVIEAECSIGSIVIRFEE